MGLYKIDIHVYACDIYIYVYIYIYIYIYIINHVKLFILTTVQSTKEGLISFCLPVYLLCDIIFDLI